MAGKASADDTVQVVALDSASDADKIPRLIAHPTAVRCLLPISLTDLAEPYLITGADDTIRSYDISSLQEPDLLGVVDAHWHDVTELRLWMRTTSGNDGQIRVEPWVISASLDGTLRKWRLAGKRSLSGSIPLIFLRLQDLLSPPPPPPASNQLSAPDISPIPAVPEDNGFQMTEEEERELAELMDSD